VFIVRNGDPYRLYNGVGVCLLLGTVINTDCTMELVCVYC